MRVSVVICTYNRADGLTATIESLRLQRHRDFEVVVVNGPSTDHTAEVLGRYGSAIRVVNNPHANLSISRNLGIRAAGGEIVAFIDDDALPEPSWLEQAVPHFADLEVAGVGGIVLDHTGMALQYRYSAASRFGEPSFSKDVPFDGHCVPGSAAFPYLQGTNALFRRDALARIGLFDETFDFYLDETDVCCRIVDSGYVLRQLADSPVHHKYLPSARRNERRVVTNWSSIVRNHVYFGYRHALVDATEVDVLEHAQRFRDFVVNDARYHESMGAAPIGHVERAQEACASAIAEGVRLGHLAMGHEPSPVALDPPEFSAFPGVHGPDRLRVVLVSSGYTPNVTGGIARFISDVAPQLAALGHEVRVFARSSEVSTVDLEDGVWVHRMVAAAVPGAVPEAPGHVDGFATAVADELQRIAAWWSPDVVYGSLWDVEMLGIARRMPEIAVMPMLATPVAEVAGHEGWDDPANPFHETFRVLVGLERELMARAVCVHAISDAIVESFAHLYPGALHSSRIEMAHIGRRDEIGDLGVTVPPSPLTVLFVGRLEARKGIDTFLDAAEPLLGAHPQLEVVVAGDDRRPGPDGVTYPDGWAARDAVGGDRLRFVGPVDDAELRDLLHRSSIVVMPSRYESFGLVAVEAMMFGRAVVASDIGGIAEVVENGVAGLLCPVGDAQALAGALDSLIRDEAQRSALGARARDQFVRHLDVRAAARRLEGVLRAAVARTGDRRPVGAGVTE